MKDLSNKEDIKKLIDHFYTQVKQDQVIGPVFLNKIEEQDWPAHLELMYNFWNTVLFDSLEYRGNPFSKHLGLKLQDVHFDRWLELMQASVQANFEGEKADEILDRADKMSQVFKAKFQDIRANPGRYPIM